MKGLDVNLHKTGHNKRKGPESLCLELQENTCLLFNRLWSENFSGQNNLSGTWHLP